MIAELFIGEGFKADAKAVLILPDQHGQPALNRLVDAVRAGTVDRCSLKIRMELDALESHGDHAVHLACEIFKNAKD